MLDGYAVGLESGYNIRHSSMNVVLYFQRIYGLLQVIATVHVYIT